VFDTHCGAAGGFDFQSAVGTEAWGACWEWGVHGTYILAFDEIQAPSLPKVSLLNTLGNPINLRLQSNLRWEWRALSVNVDLNFQNSYLDGETTPTTHISSWTTFDTQFRVRVPETAAGLLGNLDFEIAVRNAFNKDPPIAVNRDVLIFWDPANGDLLKRTITVNLVKRW